MNENNGKSDFMAEFSRAWTSRFFRKVLMGTLVVGVIVGLALSGPFSHDKQRQEKIENPNRPKAGGSDTVTTLWTCSMHPQVKLPKPGKCPICGMELIPIAAHGEQRSSRRYEMSETAEKLAEIQTIKIRRRVVPVEIRMAGKVEADETKISFITAWTAGRIDRLYIEETGIPVKRGDHMALIYSPELLSAQQEYLQALAGTAKFKDSHLEVIRQTSESTLVNAREKLKLLGITDKQILELEKRGKGEDSVTLFSSATGIVVNIHVRQGDYVQTGSRIYSVTDLSQVWVKLDAYESDLQWLRYGQEVTFEAEAYPGRIFKSRIAFIDPIVNDVTRTVKVRLNVENEEYLLKPGMFVRAVVHAEAGHVGEVVDDYLANKWICPMHPGEIKDAPGTCSICGMDLVSAESLGLLSSQDIVAPLVVPASAVLRTGKRAVVYVRLPEEAPTYEGREILLGPRTGDFYVVEEGLREGEEVVTHGNFKIDSALQIEARPSMMSAPQDVPSSGASQIKKEGGVHDHA